MTVSHKSSFSTSLTIGNPLNTSNPLTITDLQTTPLDLTTSLQNRASRASIYSDALSGIVTVNSTAQNNNGSGINSGGTLSISIDSTGTLNATVDTFNNPADIDTVVESMSLTRLGSFD